MTPRERALVAALRVYQNCACNRCSSLNCGDISTAEQLHSIDVESTKSIISAYLNELDDDSSP